MASPKKAALGKGLSALLPSQPDDAGDETGSRTRLYNFEERRRLAGRVAELDLDAIRPNPYQPRTDFDETALDELASSISQLGIIQPLTVRALGEGRYEWISGERRLRASRRAGLKRVPAYVREADTEAMLEMAIVENVQRSDLNPLDEALGYEQLIAQYSYTQNDLGEVIGKSRSHVANSLRLLKLPESVRGMLSSGELSAGHARAIVSTSDPEALARQIVDGGLSVRDAEKLAQKDAQRAEQGGSEQLEKKSVEKDADTLALERNLTDRLGLKVAVNHKGRGGSLKIDYKSLDQLESLCRILGADL